MRTFVLATILVSLAMVFTAGAACDNVPSTKMEYACRACHSNWYHVCRDALQSAPDAAEVSTYALIATRKANLKYSDTMMLGVGILPGEEREAISHCKKYGEACGQMASGAGHLSGCDFMHTRQEYMDALTAIRSCLDRLHGSFRSLPLYAMVAADFSLTGVANDLEALINVG
ncbi:hypothetical protein GQ55_6G030200 [Panicum hallii var. hallii]|uniref:Pectinesterase inhibitor domain-containing protein n=1 Tax=Panicum hallii var. hallii TaxID=1504633 RepID=A0A2T7D3D2_9POAL|nr:hypothetical protein GQ55_6G030200 [Panicum hallii var. hallii]